MTKRSCKISTKNNLHNLNQGSEPPSSTQVGETEVKSGRQSGMEEYEGGTQVQGFHGSFQDTLKLRSSGVFDKSRLNLGGKVVGSVNKVDKVKEAKLNAKLMKHSPEDYDEIGNLRQVPLTCRPNLWTV